MMEATISNKTLIYFPSFWSGTKRSSKTELIDEHGKTFSFLEITNELDINLTASRITGFQFPEAVALTRDFKLRTNDLNNECMCLCKTVDVPLWRGLRPESGHH